MRKRKIRENAGIARYLQLAAGLCNSGQRDRGEGVKFDLLNLWAMFPWLITVWSDIVPQKVWKEAWSVERINKARIKVNKTVSCFMARNGGGGAAQGVWSSFRGVLEKWWGSFHCRGNRFMESGFTRWDGDAIVAWCEGLRGYACALWLRGPWSWWGKWGCFCGGEGPTSWACGHVGALWK